MFDDERPALEKLVKSVFLPARPAAARQAPLADGAVDGSPLATGTAARPTPANLHFRPERYGASLCAGRRHRTETRAGHAGLFETGLVSVAVALAPSVISVIHDTNSAPYACRDS